MFTNDIFSLSWRDFCPLIQMTVKTLFLITFTTNTHIRQPSSAHSLYLFASPPSLPLLGDAAAVSRPDLLAETLCLHLPILTALSCIHSTPLIIYILCASLFTRNGHSFCFITLLTLVIVILREHCIPSKLLYNT